MTLQVDTKISEEYAVFMLIHEDGGRKFLQSFEL